MPLPPVITDVCREFFGTRAKNLRDNRCGQCPLRGPCLKWGAAPARTFAEMTENRETFAAEAREVLQIGDRRP